MSIDARAVWFVEPNKVEVRPFGLPEIGEDQVLVRTRYSGISAGTELWCLTGRFWERKFPAIPGYQKAGVIEQVGSNVTHYQPGDRVFLRSTQANADVPLQWGGHTSHSVVEASDESMFKLPEGVGEREACMLTVAAVGFRGAAEVTPIEPGETVVVMGLGPIGQFAAQTARNRGARVIGIDLIDQRLDLARQLADAHGLNPGNDDLDGAIKQLCPGGVDVVIDTSAHVASVNRSFNWLRSQGKYCFQAFYPETTALDLLVPHIKELVMYNPIDSSPAGHRQCAADAAAGRLRIAELISHEMSIDEAPQAYEMLLEKRSDVMSVVLAWS